MKRMSWLAGLLLLGATAATAAGQDAQLVSLLDPKDIGPGWILVDQMLEPITPDQPYPVEVAEYAGPNGERVLVDVAVVDLSPENINTLGKMLGARAANFGNRADVLVAGAEVAPPTDVCTHGAWWQGADPLLDDPALVGMCVLDHGTVAVIVGSGPSPSIENMTGHVAELLAARLT
jgi:hypothetical protein